ncbi:MAG: CHAT domain-containing protein [Coleofasciculus sp. G3-WIS-01]|uniref:CHAT domain-containing protein n=1 Tax=Coleofasciculus sp. G3-WIS-01 TaxID=3069528 RepID=UPI00330074DD
MIDGRDGRVMGRSIRVGNWAENREIGARMLRPYSPYRPYRKAFVFALCFAFSVLIVCLLHIPAQPAQVVSCSSTESVCALPSAVCPLPSAVCPPTRLSQQIQEGRTYYDAGQFAQAAYVWEQVAASLASQGDELNQAMVLSNLSLAYQHLGQWSQAKGAIAKSLELLTNAQETGDKLARPRVFAQALNTQAQLQFTLGQTEQALFTWQQATEVYHQADDLPGILRSQINQAQALKRLGFYRRAVNKLTEVYQTLENQPDSLIKAAGLRSLGSTFLLVGNVESAQTILQQSWQVAQQLDSALEMSATLLDLGNTARAGQEIEAAMEFYLQAAAIAPSPRLRLQAQLHQLSLQIQQQQWQQAEYLVPQIQSQLDTIPDSRGSVYAQIDLAKSLIALSPNHSDPEKLYTNAGRLLAKTLQQAQRLEDKPATAHALGNLGSLYEQTQQWDYAQQFTEQALRLAQAIQAPDIAYRFSWQLGRLLNAQGNTQGAIAAYTEAVDILQGLRQDLVAISPDVQFAFTETVEPVYRQLVNLLLPTGEENPSQDNLVQARNVIESLKLVELENFFREACLNPQPQSIDQVDPTAAVIYPILLPNHLAVILSLPGQPLSYYETQLAQAEVESTLERFRQLLSSKLPSRDRLLLSEQVYDWLIRPIETHLTANGIKTLVFVPDSGLQNIPMAALYDGNRYLLESYNIAIAPSLQLVDPKPLPQQTLRTLTAGLTQARHGFSSLPNVAQEVAQIKTEIPSVVLLDQDFTRDALYKAIESSYFPIVHIATHGQFSSTAQDTFVLAWDEPIQVKQFDTILQSANLNRHQAIELLVLSACETAQGDKRAALGLAGMAVRAGAQSTIGSLWRVDDAATGEFMSVFYQELTNNPSNKAEALRRTQLALRQKPQYQFPYYWAPFVLVGNWL